MQISVFRSAKAPEWWNQAALSIERLLRQVAGRTGATGAVADDATLGPNDGSAFADATAAPITITLPPAETAPGRIYTAKKIDASANTVTLAADGAETIEGAATFDLTTQFQSVTVQSDGATWWTI